MTRSKTTNKVCRVCGEQFVPYNSLQVVCRKYSCVMGAIKAKKKTQKQTLRKLAGRTNDELRHTADRKTQEKYTEGLCESCEEKLATCVHHYIYKSQSNFLRYYKPNLIPICNECHARHHKSGDSEVMSRVIAHRGIEWEQELQRLRRTPCKLTDEHLVEVIKQLEEKASK